MKRFFISIINLGTSSAYSPQKNRDFKRFNLLNLVMAGVFLFSAIADLLHTYSTSGTGQIGIAFYRLLMIVLLCCIDFFLVAKGKEIMARMLFVFGLPPLLLILPTVVGNVIDEYFFWYPYALVGISILPFIVITSSYSRILLFSALVFYFFLGFYIDRLLVFFSTIELKILPILEAHYFFYKFAYSAVFLFVNFSMYYLFHLNSRYEVSLQEANVSLEDRGRELMENNIQLNAHRAELEEKNEELEQILEELQQTQDQLVQSEKMASLGTLTAGITHEINNPMNFIYASIQGIEEELDSNDAMTKTYRTMLSRAVYGCERVTKIIDGLKNFSYQSDGIKRLFMPEKIIDNTLLILNSKINNLIRVEKDYRFPNEIMCFEDKLHQVLLNIVDNAIFAVRENSPTKGKILSLRTFPDPEDKHFMFIEIANNGPFISERNLSSLFDPFYTTKDPGDGTGLGLSISYTIIKDHNGSIKAENRQDEVCFILRLPIE